MNPTAGVSLKAEHYAEALEAPAADLWFEVHAENYMCAGGPRLAWLHAIRDRCALSIHGVGLSLASDEDPDIDHLASLKALVDRFEPFVVSEHLAWCRLGRIYYPDLLPFPRTTSALQRIAANIGRAQDFLGRSLLIENPTSYAALSGHEIPEAEFLSELARRTGCGLLLDVNNVYVSANNLGFSAPDYIDTVPARHIGEIHLAGHEPDPQLGRTLLIDAHSTPVSEDVWRLYARLIARIGPTPTLIERDENIPSFPLLLSERAQAQAVLEGRHV